MGKRKLTIAYIGNGKSANLYHIPYVLARTDKYNIKKVYCRSKSNWSKFDKINYTSELEEILGDDEIDLVVVCTPNDTHYQFAKLVLNAGKNCLVEKPFTILSSEARQLFDLAEAKGLCICSYQNRRYDGDYLTMKKVIESGKLGELLEVETHFDYFRPEIPESCIEYNVANSFIYRNACHSIDQVISYFGAPDYFHFDVRQLLGSGRMNDYYDVDFYYGKLKVSVKASYFRLRKRPAFVLYGKKGVFIKEKRDRQETDLKKSYFPYEHKDFGRDEPEDYGKIWFKNKMGKYIEEVVPSVGGDYGRVYDELYEIIVNKKQPSITRNQIILQIQILERLVEGLI